MKMDKTFITAKLGPHQIIVKISPWEAVMVLSHRPPQALAIKLSETMAQYLAKRKLKLPPQDVHISWEKSLPTQMSAAIKTNNYLEI